MRRDAVSINERVLRGEQGMEAIVGALTRCILAQTTRATTSTQVRVTEFLQLTVSSYASTPALLQSVCL
jgi:hypothetical protein